MRLSDAESSTAVECFLLPRDFIHDHMTLLIWRARNHAGFNP